MIPDIKVQAKWIHPACGRPIENGVLVIKGGRIEAVSKSTTGSSGTIDLGEVALIPGLVNAHTHLEFSHLSNPIGKKGMPFTDWIKLVVANRIENSGAEKSAAIRKGIAESTEAGVVAVGEIATEPIEISDYESPIDFVLFMERLGRDPDRVDLLRKKSNEWLSSFPVKINATPAISPHAPYSVHPDLLDTLIQQSRQFHCPVAMHLAETREEIELICNQTGPFVDLLQSLNAWHPQTFRTGARISDCLKTLATAHRAQVIHGNYLTDSDINFVAANKSNMSVVYCARTHDYFCHETYPLHKFLNAGIDVAVGTDSRASNPDLDLFAELQMIHSRFPELETSRILQMGTIAGATGLSLEDRYGSISSGKLAAVNVVDISELNELFHSCQKCVPLDRYLLEIT